MADLEEHLRDIVRAAEPSIQLAGPEAARARGRRRRARKRAALAASAVFTAAALTIGSWQLLPGDDPTRTLPAGPPSAPRPTVDIRSAALLPPSALPFDAEAHWSTVRESARVETPLLDLGTRCRLTDLDGEGGKRPVGQRSRSYRGRTAEQLAQHTINAYARERDAIAAYDSVEKTLETRCGLRGISGLPKDSTGSRAEPRVRMYPWTSRDQSDIALIVLMRSGEDVAVLKVPEMSGFGDGYTDGVTTHCVAVSLWRLHPHDTPSPPPYDSNPEAAEKRC